MPTDDGLSAGMRLINAVMDYYRESETQARRRIYSNGDAWKAEAIRRIESGITEPNELFNPDNKWRLRP